MATRGWLIGLLTTALLAGVAGCGGTGGDAGRDGPVTIYVSAPLSGERAAEGRAIIAGAKAALAEAGGLAGEVKVSAVYLDDTGGGERWDPVATAENAREAVQDSSAIGFIGDLDSGATRISLPITNQADMVQISPGASAVDLTRRVSAELEPSRYRPSDDQTFARLVPAADVQQRAERELAGQVSAPIRPARSITECRSGQGTSYVISPAFLPPAGGNGFSGVAFPTWTAYGQAAMTLLLNSIEAAGTRRDAVVDEVLASGERDSVLGSFSFTEEGDTTLNRFAVLRLDGCKLTFEREVSAPER